MAIVTIPVFGGGMTTVTGHLVPVLGMSGTRSQSRFLTEFGVAVRAGGPVLDILLGQISCTVTVHFGLLVAVHAEHTLLVMNIRFPAVFTRIFGINPSAVAESAGFPLILFNEFVALNKTDADTTHGCAIDVTITAGGVAASAGLLKNLFIELFQFRFVKAPQHALTLADGCIMQRFFIGLNDLFVAHGTGFQIIGGSFYKTLVSFFPGDAFDITLVAAFATHSEMGVSFEQGLINEVAFVHVFRPDRRRSTSSPFPLGGAGNR